MDFKNMNLDQSKIPEVINKYGFDKNPEIIKKGKGYHYNIKKDGEVALIIFYFNKDGTTTIDPTVGKNTELSKEFAQFVKTECLITSINQGFAKAPNISGDEFSLLFDYFDEIGGITILSDEKDGDTERYRLKSPYNDEVTLTYYSNQTLLLQGRPLYLFQIIKLFLYEILSLDQVVANESEIYKIDLRTEQVRAELKAIMPTAFDFLDERLIKIFTPSLALNKLEVDLEDYSSFAFPALRGLEGYIRQLLIAKGQTNTVRYTNKLGAIFEDGPDDACKLIDEIREDIPCNNACCALESAYTLLKSKRHPYFHVKTQIATTPIIWHKKDAESLIFDVFNTIEQTYSKIP